MLVTEHAAAVAGHDYPDSWPVDDLRLPVTYQFEPGDESDGVTVRVPVGVLNRVHADEFSWQVPGLRLDLVAALIRALPKPLRRHFVPAPDIARAALDHLDPAAGGSLLEALADELHRSTGVDVRPEDFDLERVPAFLRITFVVVDGAGVALGSGKDLDALRAKLAPAVREEIAQVAASIERTGLRGWDFDPLPDSYEQRREGLVIRGFPALVDEGPTVGVRVLETAAQSTWAATRRLLLLNVASPAKMLQRQLGNDAKLALTRNAPGGVTPLLDDCLAAALDEIIAAAGGPPHDAAGFEQLLAAARTYLGPALTRIVTEVVSVLAVAHDVERHLKGTAPPALLPALVDMRTQLAGLVYPGFVSGAGSGRLADLRRYLRAIERRLEKVGDDVNRDRARMWEVEQATQAYSELRSALPPGRAEDDDVRAIRWMIEEFRVSLFAQALGTPRAVSLPRILREIDALR
jgi:ATP-dependent helicase HrpA